MSRRCSSPTPSACASSARSWWRVFLSALDQTVVGTALPTDHHRPRRQQPLHVGHHRLPADGDDQRAALRQDLRPVRPPAGVPVRHQRVHRSARCWPACSQEMWQLVAARGIQGLGAGAMFPLAMATIADLFSPSERGRYQGLFGAVFGHVEPARPGHRRPDHRHHRLAVRVLRQHPDRPRGPVHDPALPARVPPGRRQAEDRLPRRGAVHGRAGADPHRPHQQAVGRLDRPHRGRPDPAGRARAGRVRVDRVAGGRADRPARAVPDPRVRGLGRARCSWPCSGSSPRWCSCRAGSRSSAARRRRSRATRCCRSSAG